MVTFLEQQEWGKPRTQLELDQVEQKFQMRLNWERALLILITVSPSADDAQMRKIWQKEPGRQSHLWSNVPYLGRNLRRNLGRIVLQTTGEIIVGTFLAWYKVTRTSVCEFLFECYTMCCVLVTQSCQTLCNPMDCSQPGSSVHEDSPGKNTGVGSHSLLLGIFPTRGSNLGLLHCRQILYQLSHQGLLNFIPPV